LTHDIDRPELAFDFVEGGLELAALFEIDPKRDCGDAERQQFLERGLVLFLIAGEDCDRRSGLGQTQRESPSNTAIPAGDDRYLAAQIEHLLEHLGRRHGHRVILLSQSVVWRVPTTTPGAPHADGLACVRRTLRASVGRGRRGLLY